MLYMAHLRGDIFIQDGFTGWFYWLVGWLVEDDHWPPNVAIGPFRGAAINLHKFNNYQEILCSKNDSKTTIGLKMFFSS